MRWTNSMWAAGALVMASAVNAASIGKLGPTYPIQEPDMLQWIEARVRAKVESGEALRYQQERAEAAKHKLLNPKKLTQVSKALTNSTFYFDPSIEVQENVFDDKGRLLVLAGTVINPLDRVALTRPLIFFDATDPVQTEFARKFLARRHWAGKAILVGGSYVDLMKAWQTPVYFDQQGALIRQLNIKQVPAIVQQEGRRLRIDEIAL